MRSAVRLAGAAIVALGCVWFAGRHAPAADVLLADWENSGPTGMGGAGTDFDPAPIDGTPSCTGCWLKGNAGVMSTLTQSTVGVTSGTKSMQISMVGRGLGGGDGLQDTHFDLGARVFWAAAVTPQYPTGDPRFFALRDAINGNQGLFTIEMDLTYNIPALRALHWLGPPVDFPAKPVNFIGMGLYKNTIADAGGFTHVLEQVLPTLINPNAPQFDGVTLLTRHVSIPLSQFSFTPNPVTLPTNYEMGFSINGNWGTNPASSNTEAASFYVDNLMLKQFDPVRPIDFNNNDLADLVDWRLFMEQALISNPPVPPLNPDITFDLVGDFGAAGTNGVVDFHDLQEFERLYNVANPGLSLAAAIAQVPEPSAFALALLAMTLFLAPVTKLPSRS